MAPKPAQAATLAAARLPGTRESHLLAQSNSAPDNPARNAKLPIMMNNGITIDLFADGVGKYVIPKENASDEFYEDAYIVKVSGVIDFYPPATTGY